MRVNKEKVRLFVPKEGLEAYKAKDSYAGFFKDIYAFGEEVSNPLDVTDSSAVISWFPAPGVVAYTVDLYTAGRHIAQYTVDGSGEVTSARMARFITRKAQGERRKMKNERKKEKQKNRPSGRFFCFFLAYVRKKQYFCGRKSKAAM